MDALAFAQVIDRRRAHSRRGPEIAPDLDLAFYGDIDLDINPEIGRTDPTAIRLVAERSIQLLRLKSLSAHLPNHDRAGQAARVRGDIEDDTWTSAPNPSPDQDDDRQSAPLTPEALNVSAFATCLVIGVAMWAARLGVPIQAVEVEAQTAVESPSEIRYAVSIESDAEPHLLDEVIDIAERHSPYPSLLGQSVVLKGEPRRYQSAPMGLDHRPSA